MGVNLEQLVESLRIANENMKDIQQQLKTFVLDEDNKLDKAVATKLEAAMQIFTSEEPFEPVRLIDEQYGIQDAPVGTILTYMGNRAPMHYLPCDGTIYNITDYPYLADHFAREFEKVNYFGGDGEITFAVPDLRGEFLRGTGTNSRTNQGSGANVGKHQDATGIPRFGIEKGTGRPIIEQIPTASSNNVSPENQDTNYDRTGTVSSLNGRTVNTMFDPWASSSRGTAYTVRPTNTSVLYCIKMEPTFFANVNPRSGIYSTEERIVGKWVDGKPIYRKCYDLRDRTITARNTGIDAPADIDSYIRSFSMACNNNQTYIHSPYANGSGATVGFVFDSYYDERTNKIMVVVSEGWVNSTTEWLLFLEYTKK